MSSHNLSLDALMIDSQPQIGVIGNDEFTKLLTEHLGLLFSLRCFAFGTIEHDTSFKPTFYLATCGYRGFTELGAAAAVARSSGIPFIPVMLRDSILSVGPVLMPTSSPCWKCLEVRALQHSPAPELEMFLSNYYSETSHYPGGAFTSITLMAVEMIILLFADCVGGQTSELLLYDFAADVMTRSTLIPVSCCECLAPREVANLVLVKTSSNTGASCDAE